MAFLDLPDLTREALAELGGWTALRQARRIIEEGRVRAVDWRAPVIEGRVEEHGRVMETALDLRSLTFPRVRCGCPDGRRGQVCAHAIALCLAIRRKAEEQAAAPAPQLAAAGQQAKAEPSKGQAAPAAAPDGPVLRSLRVDPGGEPLGIRLWLPPNLEAAAKRNAIVSRLVFIAGGARTAPEKLFKGRGYAVTEGQARVLGYLEELSGGSLYGVIQLKRAQLRFIVETGCGELLFHLGGEGAPPLDDPFIRERLLPMLEEDKAALPKAQVRRSGAPRAPRPAAPAARAELLPDNWMVIDGSTQFLSVLLRERDHPQYRRCVEWLRAEGFQKEPSNGKWWLRDAHKVLNFLANHRQRLEADYDPGYTDNFRTRTAVIQPVPLACETAGKGDGYAVRMELKAEGIDIRDVRNALVSGRHYIIREDRVHLIEKPVLDKLEAASRSLGRDPGLPLTGIFETRLSGAELAHAEGLLDELDFELELPEDWARRSAAIREVGKLAPPPLEAAIRARFRTYQLVGTAWMWHLCRNGLGGILADEMGLGKTIQAIGLLLCWKAQGTGDGPALVVAPASLLGNWRRELSQWAPGLDVYLHHGPGRLTAFGPDDFDPDVCLTSYSTLRNDHALFQGQPFSLAIADEAQHVKNRRSHAARSLRAVRAGARFVLTGTPIENSIEDLRALFDFCLPGYLKRPPEIARGDDRQWHERQHLERAAPYILRRSKAMVAPELPEKIEQTLWCGMDSRQRDLYDSIRLKTEQTLLQLAASGVSENRLRFTLLTELLRLRQVCADPGLLDPGYPLEESVKFQIFTELLSEAMDGGHRILVFSQFVKLLKRLRGWFEAEGLACAYIDGSTRDRLAVCDRFNGDPGIPVCLISLKAGGTGLNLTGADTVVHFDPWWNPAVEDQATDRAHRIGQSRTVTSYKLVTEGTVEDKVLALQLKKSMLLKDLLDESALHSAKVDLSTLKSLLD
jgi:superfamily II DNA or RNA helicase